jgi:hypothetical protein
MTKTKTPITVDQKLKELAIAYSLACEFDYCPDEDRYDEAKEYFGEFDESVLIQNSGRRPDEIASHIIGLVLGTK